MKIFYSIIHWDEIINAKTDLSENEILKFNPSELIDLTTVWLRDNKLNALVGGSLFGESRFKRLIEPTD